MSPAAHPPKRRQYAAGESRVYYGSAEGQQSLSSDIYHHPFEESESTQLNDATLAEPAHVDLMTYPPDPRDLPRIPPPEIRLPPTGHAKAAPGRFSPQSGSPVPEYQYQSCTLNAVPSTESLLHSVKIPLGLVVSPYRTLAAEDSEEPVPLVQDGVIARCEACRAYINPYVRFFDAGTKWRCALCGAPNGVPQAFFDYSGSRGDRSEVERFSRAELTRPVVDFAATAEYAARDAPQAPAYVFLIDVSQDAMRSGMFAAAVHALLENLDRLPNEGQRTRVALVCFDAVLYFFALPRGARAFEMLVVSDLGLQAAYAPRPQCDLLVRLADARGQLRALLQRLPDMFAGAGSGSATGPALEGALALISPTGGKIVLLSASVPTRGRGALDAQQSSFGRDNTKEIDADKSASAFYHAFALACIKACVSVDMFLFGERYRGVATLTLLPQYTSGQTFYYPAFKPDLDTVKFATELGRVLAMPILLEAEMRVRCSRGISVKSIHGNFFLQGTDRAVMPAVPLDQAYAFEFEIDASLQGPLAVFQTALLHTTSAGARRIRVLTLALPTTSVIAEVFASANLSAIITLLTKQTVRRPSVRTLEDKRETLVRFVADLCAAYMAATKAPPSELTLLVPANLRMLPVLLLGLFKKISTRPDTEMALDMRAYARALLSSAPPPQLIRYIYPNVYSLHNMPDEVGFIGAEGGTLRMPPPLPLTSAWWEPHGLYLIDDGQAVSLWVGRDAVPRLVRDVFGVADYGALRGGKIALPDIDTAISQRIRAIVGEIRGRGGTVHYPSVCVVKDDAASGAEDAGLRSAAVQTLIHDRGDELRLSYRQFLLKIQGK